MVEIKHTDPISSQEAGLAASGSSADSSDDGKYRLIYSKSKVYVNPTAYARDNIPGFVALVKKVCQLWLYYAAPSYIIGFMVSGGCAARLFACMDPGVSIE